ncbi:hypothetical protein OUZ56_029541 [Daphnia magna]|uniref:Uncharacterized protein n=1 Tax=Daphnia magna TaxID=35525 RepID=A0ABR0B741_9CRUS|nr:hypothetical protein OUZ56_029541 [Daphnia magna]
MEEPFGLLSSGVADDEKESHSSLCTKTSCLPQNTCGSACKRQKCFPLGFCANPGKNVIATLAKYSQSEVVRYYLKDILSNINISSNTPESLFRRTVRTKAA